LGHELDDLESEDDSRFGTNFGIEEDLEDLGLENDLEDLGLENDLGLGLEDD